MDDQEREPLLNHAADNGRWRDCAVQIPDPDEKLTDINECAASDSHRLYRICGRRRLKKCLSITCGLLLIFAIIIIVCWLTVVPAIINGQLSVVKIKVDDVQVFPGNAEGLDNQNSFEMTIQYSLQQLPSSR
jgi:hypothetical protein